MKALPQFGTSAMKAGGIGRRYAVDDGPRPIVRAASGSKALERMRRAAGRPAPKGGR